ncbi:hypothetical protein BDP81DRAFT_445739 [Colletotrichum phormii]|uniref:Uncharacterized protein n=1 Tax=Colletotrichum phormii TaxID=359342 RepID=A0AAJ0A332_9PEZI|nr:uncharacterized protein BDP81DRAFT_445739 [Colletotrichum phormii]KAK1655073.1 hypothetical protein BDP81DRAFT_445739 [Colletotrichum phormii]
MADFMWRQVPIEETQLGLRQLIQIANEERIQDIFAKFLTAPTELPDEKAGATKTLCQIFGIEGLIATNQRKPYEIFFKGDDERTWFLAHRIPRGREVSEAATVMREEVKNLVGSEPKLSQLVSNYYKLCDMSEEAVEAARSRREAHSWT